MKTKVLLTIFSLLMAVNIFGQRKFSQLPVASVSDSVRLIGVETISGVSTDNRYSLHDLSYYIGGIGSQNIANASLHWNGNYTQDVNKYSLFFNKVNSWKIYDTASNPLFLLNDGVVLRGMLFANSVVNLAGAQTVEGFSSLSLNYAGGIAHSHIHSRTAIIELHDDLSQSRVRASVGTGVNNWELDSTVNNFSILHLTGNSSTPGIAVGAGSGVGALVSLSANANDISGCITLTTGSSPVALGNAFTISFNVPYSHPPECVILTPANQATQLLAVNRQVYIDQLAIVMNSFPATCGTVALAASTTYKWYYLVVE